MMSDTSTRARREAFSCGSRFPKVNDFAGAAGAGGGGGGAARTGAGGGGGVQAAGSAAGGRAIASTVSSGFTLIVDGSMSGSVSKTQSSVVAGAAAARPSPLRDDVDPRSSAPKLGFEKL